MFSKSSRRFSLSFSLIVSCSVVSNSLQPHWLQPTKLICPWDSPSKNTGVVAIPFSRGSSQPRDQTQVSCIVGRFFLLKGMGGQGRPRVVLKEVSQVPQVSFPCCQHLRKKDLPRKARDSLTCIPCRVAHQWLGMSVSSMTCVIISIHIHTHTHTHTLYKRHKHNLSFLLHISLLLLLLSRFSHIQLCATP